MKFKMCFVFLSILINIFNCQIYSQADSSDYEFDFLPSGLHFQSIKANCQEAKIGVLYFPLNANLKLDLGNSIDLLSFRFPSENIRLTMGIDFSAYALSTSFAGSRLQIDALDGLFGGNVVFSRQFNDDRFLIRFRILHNSAHLVDGHFDQRTDEWIDGKKPIPFTKDFGEFIFMYEYSPEFVFLKSYGGLSYATLVRPASLKRWNYITGLEMAFPSVIGNILNKPAILFASFNYILNGENKYMGNSDLMGGIKFGRWKGKGILFYAEYYAGQRRFNEYFRERVKEYGIGFYVDF
jgi:hypothetical protein